MNIYFLVFLIIFGNAENYDVTIDGKKTLLDEIKYAENKLKIYIYSKPLGYDQKIKCENQFKAESMIPSVIKKKLPYTNNPEEANIFLIDHDFTCMFNFGAANFPNITETVYRRRYLFRRHLKPIFYNIIHKYPYFNRTGGKDHLFIMTSDLGPYCQYYEKPIRNVFNHLQNVTFLLNFGYNGYMPKNCNRNPNQDIIIPQYHTWKINNNKPILKYTTRKFDSYFRGSYKNRGYSSPTIRYILENISSIPKLKFYNVHRMNLDISNAYFAICPAGYAPWSKRLYEAIMFKTIPIIIANGIIQPFERFLNWTKFTVKMNTAIVNEYDNIIYDKDKIISFLIRLNQAGNEYRHWLDNNEKKNSIIISNLPYIEYKLKYLQEASYWLHWDPQHKTSIWKLLLLEMWCRTRIGSREDFCKKSNPSQIAYEEYW